jgi:hypothetical protein
MAIFVALPDGAFGTDTFFGRRACLSPGVRPFKQLRIAAAALDSHPVAWCFLFRFDVPNHDVPTFRSTMFVFHGNQDKVHFHARRQGRNFSPRSSSSPETRPPPNGKPPKFEVEPSGTRRFRVKAASTD